MSLKNSQLGEIHSLKATDYIVWLLEWTYTIFSRSVWNKASCLTAQEVVGGNSPPKESSRSRLHLKVLGS